MQVEANLPVAATCVCIHNTNTMQQYAVIQMKGHATSHPSPYQRLGIATPTPLGHLWSTTASKPEHASWLTQQLGGKGGKTRATNGLDSTLQVYTYSSKQPTFQYRLHTSGSEQDSHYQAPMRPSPSQGGAQNGYKKPALLGLKPDGILIHPQQYNAPGLLNKSTPCQNGRNFSLPGYHTIPFAHQPAVHQKDSNFVAGSPYSHPTMPHSTMHHATIQPTGQHLSPVFSSPNKNQTPGGVPSEPVGTSWPDSRKKKECNCKPPKGQKPPEGYVCHLCFTAGHYIYDCPKVSITQEFTNNIFQKWR